MKIFLIIVHILLSIAIIASVLLQSGRSAGLSGAIAGGAESFFGKKKGIDDLLTKITVGTSIAFAIVSLLLYMVMQQ